MKILLQSIVVAALAAATGTDRTENFAREAAEMGRSAGLAPLPTSSSEPEIRIWRSGSLTGTVTGWIVRSEGISVYSNYSATSKERQDLFSSLAPTPVLTGKLSARQARRHLKSFSKLHSLSGLYVHCGVKDGWGFLVEGTNSNGYFAFAAGTPNVCKNEEAVSVWQAFKALADTQPQAL